MKDLTIGIFSDRVDAERAIARLSGELDIDTNDISYVARSVDGKVEKGEGDNLDDPTSPGRGAAKGAVIGGGIGAVAGLATVAGAIPVIGPLFAAGPLAVALGLTGGVATTAAGAVTGAAAGGIIGALTNLGVGQEDAERYEDHIRSGDTLLAVHSEEPMAVQTLLEESGAREAQIISSTSEAYS